MHEYGSMVGFPKGMKREDVHGIQIDTGLAVDLAKSVEAFCSEIRAWDTRLEWLEMMVKMMREKE